MGSPDYGATGLLIILLTVRFQRFPVTDFSFTKALREQPSWNKHDIEKGMGVKERNIHFEVYHFVCTWSYCS